MKRRAAIAFLLAVGALPATAEELDVAAGKALFDRAWVSAPSSTEAADGLGPLFNGRACSSCHDDGGPARASFSDGTWGVRGAVMRIGSRAGDADPFYGRQLQNRSLPGLEAEARVSVSFGNPAAGGIPGALTRSVADIVFRGPPPHPDSITELRIAPSLRGRGMIEAADAAAIVALADPQDRDGDGISGRIRHRFPNGRPAVGRFGWKASAPTLDLQVAEAASIDMGLSSPFAPDAYGDCTTAQAECRSRSSGSSSPPGGAEMPLKVVSLIASFVKSLDRTPEPRHNRGTELLGELGCTGCHVPHLPDGAGRRLPIFSDLLLHDMGPGLAGFIGAADVVPAEWRTAPLVDLESRAGTRRYLHDGRASSIDEAIRWHDGEARAARLRYESLAPQSLVQLLDYLDKL